MSEVKAIVESLEDSGILVIQANFSSQTTGSATQLEIKDRYKRLVKLIETMENVKYTINKAVQAIQKLDFVQNT